MADMLRLTSSGCDLVAELKKERKTRGQLLSCGYPIVS